MLKSFVLSSKAEERNSIAKEKKELLLLSFPTESFESQVIRLNKIRNLVARAQGVGLEFPKSYEFAFDVVRLLGPSYPYIEETFADRLTTEEDDNIPVNINTLLDRIKKRLSQKMELNSRPNSNKRAFRSAAATLQGIGVDGKADVSEPKRRKKFDYTSKSKEEIKNEHCPCHFKRCRGWKHCWYFNPNAARIDWSPKPEIVEEIDNKRTENPAYDRKCKEWEKEMKILIGRKSEKNDSRLLGAVSRGIVRSQ